MHHIQDSALQIAFGKSSAPAEACIVDEHGNWSIAQGVEDFLRGCGQGQIFCESFGFDSVFAAQFIRDLLEACLIARDKDEIEFVRCKNLREIEANAR